LGERLCPSCIHDIHKITPPICPICGGSQKSEGICTVCSANPPRFTSLRSWGFYGSYLRDAIYRLKYKRDLALGDSLASLMMECIDSAEWKIDKVIPVPIGWSRKGERGYNQAALLARPIALYHRLAYGPQGLRRKRDTRSQVGLSFGQRWKNVEDAFEAEARFVQGCSVLVVDDVTTSGATMNACAQALGDAGVKNTYCLTLARAV